MLSVTDRSATGALREEVRGRGKEKERASQREKIHDDGQTRKQDFSLTPTISLLYAHVIGSNTSGSEGERTLRQVQCATLAPKCAETN